MHQNSFQSESSSATLLNFETAAAGFALAARALAFAIQGRAGPRRSTARVRAACA
jgi:hypothetical protein